MVFFMMYFEREFDYFYENNLNFLYVEYYFQKFFSRYMLKKYVMILNVNKGEKNILTLQINM